MLLTDISLQLLGQLFSSVLWMKAGCAVNSPHVPDVLIDFKTDVDCGKFVECDIPRTME